MVRPAAKRSGLGSKQEAAGSNVFGGSDKDITDKEIPLEPLPSPWGASSNLYECVMLSSSFRLTSKKSAIDIMTPCVRPRKAW